MSAASPDIARAYQAGRMARDARQIRPVSHMVYELLVELGIKTGYAFPKETTLAEMLGMSVRSVKRSIAELVSADLITRVRQFGHATLTYITAWLAAHDRAKTGPSIGPKLAPRSSTIKGVKLNADGGGEAASSPDPLPIDVTTDEPPAAAIELLQDAGLEDPPTIRRLAFNPIERIKEVIGQVKRQRATPGLIQYKLDHGLGVGRMDTPEPPRRDKRGQVRSVPEPEDVSGYLAGGDFCPSCGAHTNGRHRTEPCEGCGADPPGGE